jgi:putative ABC transport system permease protein
MLVHDLKFAARLLRKRPGISLLVIIALLFGIGVNTAVFSVVNAVLLRPVPVFQPERVIRIFPKLNKTGAAIGGISYPEYLDWKSGANSFEAITVLRAFSFYSNINGSPENLKGSGITALGFKVLGVHTILGREFSDSDDRPEAERVVVLNYAFWQRKFGGDRNIIGKTITLEEESYTVIGVLGPAQIELVQYPDVWVPNSLFLDQKMQSRDSRYYFPVARLKSSATKSQAQTEMETIAARLAAQYPSSNKDIGVRIVGLVEQLTANGREPLSYLLAASTLIFVLACVNILIVFLSWAAERRKEFSIRLALGATQFHVNRQFLIQALMLVGSGSILGLAFSKAVLTFFLLRFPDAVLRFQETTIDYRVVGFMIAMATLVSVAATFLPGLYSSRLNISSELKGEVTGVLSSRFRSLRQSSLIVFEVMLASALSLASGLLIKSLYEVARVDLGFSPHHVISFQINLPKRYKASDQAEFYKRAVDGISNLPGLSLSSGIESLPLTTQGNVMTLQADAQSPLSSERLLVEYDSILPGLFNTMKLPLLLGRDFSEKDRDGTVPVTIIDDSLAAKYWPGQNALGKHLRLFEDAESKAEWREVVGVVREVKHFGPEAKIRFMQVYIPEYQQPTPVLSFVLNTTLPEGEARTAAEKVIHGLDSGLPLDNFQNMDGLLDKYMASRKVSLLLLSTFAGIAIVLGAIGIYGVISNSVVRRRREIAIRLALGATPRDVMILIARLGILSTCAGILLGAGIIGALTRVLNTFIFGIDALDTTVYLAALGVIILISLVATLVPAMSVLSLNPQRILRD